MKKPPSHRRYSQVLAATLLTAMLAAAQSAHAAIYTWDAGGGVTTTWSTATNWNPDGVPTFAAGDIFDLSVLNIGGASTSTMDTVGGTTLGTIKIGDTNNTHSWTLGLSTALTLNGNGSAAVINQVAQSKGDTINGAGGIVVASDLNITNASGNILQISTGITATGATRTITNNGSGFGRVNLNNAIGSGINLVQNSTNSATWMLAASASFNGTITVKAGNFEVGATGANGIGLGTAAVTLGDTGGSSDATIVFKSGNGSGYNVPITVASGSTGIKSIIGAVTSGNNTYSLNGGVILGADSSHTADVTIGNSTNNTSTWNVLGGFTGFGNVTVKTTSSGKTRFATTSINNTGTLTNASTGSGVAQIDVAVGANVTGIVQNSATSQMNLGVANPAFAGTVTVTTGTLATGSTTSLNSSNTVSVASAGTFKAGSATLTIAGLNDSTTGGTVSNTVANTLTLGGSGTYSFSGAIQNGTGTQALTKSGAGTQKLSGANTYNGATTISGGTLQLGDGGTTGSLSTSSAITNNGTLAFNRSNAVVQGTDFAAGIGGSGLVSQIGSNSLTLSGTNTYGGGTAISSGTLNVNSASAIGSGALTITGGTLDNTSGSAVTLSTNNAQNWNSNFAYTGSDALNMGTGAVTLNASRTVTVNGSTLTVGAIGDASNGYGLTKAGGGTLTLTGANTYTGTTTISAGTLALGASGSIASTTINLGDISHGTLDLTAKSSGYTFGGTLAGYGSVTMAASQTLTISGGLAPGNSPGIINVDGNLTLGSSSVSTFEVGSRNGGTPAAGTNFDQTVVSGTMTFAGTLNINTTVNDLIAGDTFKLFDAGVGMYAGHFNFVSIGGTYVASMTYDAGTFTWHGDDATNNLGFSFVETTGFLNVAAIPEPATYAALVGALTLGVAAVYRRRRAPQA